MTSFLRAGALAALLALVAGCSGDDLATEGTGGSSSGLAGSSGTSGQGGQDQGGQGGSLDGAAGPGGATDAGSGGVAGSDSGAGAGGEPAGEAGAAGDSGSSGQGGAGPVTCQCPAGEVTGLGSGQCRLPPDRTIEKPAGDATAAGAVDGSGSQGWKGGSTLEVRLPEAQPMATVTLWARLSTILPTNVSGIAVDAVLEVAGPDDGSTDKYMMTVPSVDSSNDTPIVFTLTSPSVNRLIVTLTPKSSADKLQKVGLTEITFRVCPGSSASE